jgi:hypothetical protein
VESALMRCPLPGPGLAWLYGALRSPPAPCERPNVLILLCLASFSSPGQRGCRCGAPGSCEPLQVTPETAAIVPAVEINERPLPAVVR